MAQNITEKPWYKKFKLMTALIGSVIDIVVVVIGLNVVPEKMDHITTLAVTIGAVVIVVITGHSVTDATSALKKTK